jgi:hypothetical protein
MGELDLLHLGAGAGVRAAMRATGSLAVLPPAVLFRAAEKASGDLRLVVRQPSSGGVAVVVFRQGEPTMVFLPGDGRSLGELLLAAGAVDMPTLETLVQGRVQGATSLEHLLLEKTSLPREQVQRFLDFQARARLLDVLAWEDGFFELEEYRGGLETAFSLDLPGLNGLACRAAARARSLPALLERLPAGPANVVVRRRRGGARPEDQIARAVHDAVAEPLLIPQIVARLLVDDDLVIEALLRMAEAKAVVMQPRLELAPAPAAESGADPRLGVLLREVLARTRSGAAADEAATLTVVVMAGEAGDAVNFVARLGSDADLAGAESGTGGAGIARRIVTLGDDARLCLLAIRPEALSRGALEGLLARFDALVLLRAGDDLVEMDRLQHLRSVVRGGAGRDPLTLGIELGSNFRAWSDYPEAMLGLRDWETRPSAWLLERLVEGLLAAAHARD